MDRILELQLMQAEADTAAVTTTGFSSCSNRNCSQANSDGFEE